MLSHVDWLNVCPIPVPTVSRSLWSLMDSRYTRPVFLPFMPGLYRSNSSFAFRSMGTPSKVETVTTSSCGLSSCDSHDLFRS